jgi:hypothetical protein
MRPTLLVALATLPLACGRPEAPAMAPPQPPPPPAAPAEPPAPLPPAPVVWPDGLTAVMAPHGPPHAQPLPLDAAGRERWLAVVGTGDGGGSSSDEALGAFRVARGPDGTYAGEPVADWPTAVRVVGGIREAGVTYVLLETVAALDQPGGLRGVWIDGRDHRSPFETSPLALAGTRDIDDLATRLKQPAMLGSAERNAVSLVATLRAAAASPGALARTLATDGTDVGDVWQSIFVQPVGHLDGQGAAPSALTDRVLTVVRSALETQACGVDACEAWTDAGHAVVRFVVQGGRWVIRWVLEDARPPTSAASGSPRRAVEPVTDPQATTALLRARAGEVLRVVGEAPLTSSGGSIGVGLTDLAPDAPVIAVREGAASRTFVIDQVAARKAWGDERWDAAFADVDGDGRTDVVLRMEGTRAGAATAWTQVFLAPPASVQSRSLAPDLASSYAVMEAPDVRAAALSAAALPARGISRDEACRLVTMASTPAGFRKAAIAEARVLRFDQPGLPTWLPKIVPSAKVTADDVRGLGAHCAEMSCSATRPYCSWSGGTDSQHFWFTVHDSDLAIAGAADYDGE